MSNALCRKRRRRNSQPHGPVIDLEGHVGAAEAVLKLGGLNHQGRRAVEHRRPHEAVKAVLTQGCPEGSDRAGVAAVGAVEVLDRRSCLRVDQVHATERAYSAATRNGVVLVHELVDLLLHDGLNDILRTSYEVMLKHELHALVARGQGDRVRVEGRAPAKGIVLEVILDRLPHRHHGQGHVSSREALRASHDVRREVVVLEAPELARAPEPDHDLVRNHEDAVPVADGSHPLHVALRRHMDTARANHRFQHDRRDGVRALAEDLLLEVAQSLGSALLVGGSELESVRVRGVHCLHEARR
mmetsp:Transcript_57289/g.147343  ORF Transcript_57289/g.147343 Transcript_57289/m.147343 type:complete len:300 (+) Transcript_57289:503-1402(+)